MEGPDAPGEPAGAVDAPDEPAGAVDAPEFTLEGELGVFDLEDGGEKATFAALFDDPNLDLSIGDVAAQLKDAAHDASNRVLSAKDSKKDADKYGAMRKKHLKKDAKDPKKDAAPEASKLPYIHSTRRPANDTSFEFRCLIYITLIVRPKLPHINNVLRQPDFGEEAQDRQLRRCGELPPGLHGRGGQEALPGGHQRAPGGTALPVPRRPSSERQRGAGGVRGHHHAPDGHLAGRHPALAGRLQGRRGACAVDGND